MENSQLKLLYKTFDDIKHEEDGVEFWFARELYPILGYTKWENFETVLERAKEACEKSRSSVEDHFLDVRKLIIVGKNTQQEINDVKLTRYACYLTALNGDPRKEEIAFAQAYFVMQTRKIEVIEQKIAEFERIGAREKLTISEKGFAALVFSRGVDGRGISEIRSFGDKALFGGKSTDDMKKKLGASKNSALADVLPRVTIVAKELATAMTTENTKRKDLQGKGSILNEHVSNNRGVRGVLVNSGIYPESLPPAEDIKKIVARHKKERRGLEKRQRDEMKEVKSRLKRLKQ
ncbi:MAG: DNA damage-inducible protein D [Candidatus Taylorbacteria bacterium]|nr:DNA damage-inducible protein D [Candidatus Taylorbacteria bacterium]